jgi:hypothetical protein
MKECWVIYSRNCRVQMIIDLYVQIPPTLMFIFFWTSWKHLLIEYIKQKKKLIICGDWNINFLYENKQAQALEYILVWYDLMNTVTSNSESLIDVMVTNKEFNKNYTKTVNVGVSGHAAQILRVCTDTRRVTRSNAVEVLKRKCSWIMRYGRKFSWRRMWMNYISYIYK